MDGRTQQRVFFPIRWYTNRSFYTQVALLLLPLLLLMIIVLLLGGIRAQQTEREMVLERLDTEAQDLQEQFDAEFVQISDDLRHLLTGTAIHDYSAAVALPEGSPDRREEVDRALEALPDDFRFVVRTRPLYSQIRLIDLTGSEQVRVGTIGEQVLIMTNRNIGNSDIFAAADLLELAGQIWVSPVTEERSPAGDLRPTMHIVTPVASETDASAVVGYLILDIDLTPVLQAISDHDIDDGFAFLMNEQGEYLAHSLSGAQDLLFEVSVFADTEFSESERLRDAELEWDDKPYIATSTAIRPLRVFGDVAQLPRWTLVVAAPEINVIDQLALLGVLGGTGLALFLGLSIAMVWVGGSMLRNRVQVAADGLEQLRRGDLEAKLPAMGSEFAPLTDGFNAMSDQIRGLVNGLEKRVRNRIRDLELVSEISSEVAGLRDLDLVLNRAINLIVERFGYYHAQVFLLDDIRDFAVLVASTGMPGERLLAKEHKLAVGSDSVIGRVTALGITVIAGDTESSDVPWRPNVELPDTRSEMALPLNVEGEVIGALDIQSLEPDIFTPEEIEIFQVLADQLALAINNARLIQQLQQRMDQVNVLNQRLTEKGWSGFAAESDEAPLAYRYDLMTTEPFEPADEVEGASEDNTGGFATPIEVAGSKIGLIQTTVSDSELAGEERGLVEAVAARVALAIENARLVQETQSALGEAQRLFEMARTVSSAAELDLQGIYQVIIDQLTFELRLDQVAILLAEPIPSYLVNTLKVAYVWHRGRLNGSWHVGQYLDLMQQGLSDVFAAAPAQMLEIDAQSAAANSAYMAVIDALQAHQVEMFPLVTGDRWFGVLVCATNNPQGLGQRFLDFSYAVADQLTVAIDNRRLFGEVQDEARRARALAEASQLVTQMTGDLSAGVERLFRVVSGPGEFDRWWFGLLEPDGVLLRRVAGYTPVTIPLPERVDLSTEQNALTEAIHLRQVVIINDLADTHSVAGVVSPEDQARYGKHMAMPVMLGYEEALGVVLIGRPSDELDFDERDMQLATTLASQLAVATQNQRLFDQIESQRRTLQHTLEAMPAGVLVFSPDGDVTLSNAQVKAMLGAGITQGIFAEDTYPVYVAGTRQPYPPEDFPIYRALNQRQMVSGENFAIERPDGKHIEVLLNAAPIYDEANQLLSVIAVFQEITELRELEQALQESLSETTSLYEASRSLAAASTTPELVDVLVNQLQQLAPDQVYVVLREGVDEGMPENRLAAVWPESLPRPDAVHAIPVPSRMLMVDNALILDDTENMREGGQIAAWGQQAKSNGIYSMASLPMKARGNRTLGWFAVLFEKGHTFAADERRFMTTLASQAAVSLDVIWLFESTQRALRTVANLYRGNKRVAEAQGIEEATTVVREELMRFKPDRIDLLIERNPENPEYAQSLIAWSPERSLEDIPALPLDPATLAPQVSFDIFGPEEYYIQDLSESPDGELHHALRFLDSPYRAVMSIPLRVSGHPIGRLAMGFMEPRRFSSDDRQFATMLADSAAYIVQNELLFLKTQESLEETGMLYQASRSIANAQQREDVVQAMIDHVAAGTVDKVMLINLLSETWEQQGAIIEVTATWGRGELSDLKGLHFTREQLPIWRQLAATEIIWSDDVEIDAQLDETERLGYRTLDIASFVVVPLFASGRPIGAIMLASAEPRKHTKREIRFFMSLADQAAVQLENKRLYEQAEMRARQLETSAEVSRAVTSILNLDELFPRIVNLIRDSFNYDHAQIFMVDDPNENAVLRAATGEAGRQMLQIQHQLAIGSQSVVGQATALGEAVLVNDTTETGVTHRHNPYLPDTRAELAIPLLLKGEVVGVIDVQANRAGTFSDDDIQVLTSLADQIAIAIDNAELFEISQQRGADMAFLFDATSTAAVSGGLLEALETVATVLIRQLNGHETGIFLHDPEQDLLNAEVVVIAEPQDDGVAYRFVDTDESVPVGQGVIGNVAAAQDPMIIRDFKEERRFFPWLTHSRSGIYVPLALGERLIGVMGIEAARPGQYDNNDLRLLQTLSTSLSAIIQSAQLVEELQATNERLREIDQLKTNFLAAMSHELRTPLNSIIGFSRVILKGIDGPISDMQRQDIQTIHDSGKHLLGLVNDILDQAKIEAGKMELVKEYFDLAAVVKGVMSSAKGLTKDKPIQLYTEIQDDLPQAFGDEFRTRQILFNLVSNAAKFTHEGSITVSTFSTASSEDDRTMILVSVADTGIGIAQEDQESIFASFQQVDNSTTRSVEGTGLGLPLARSLAELQGGALWLESEVGTGSTFFVSVPIEPPPAEEGGGEDSAPVAVQSIQVSGRDTVELAPVTPRMMNDADKTLPVRPKRRTMLAVDNELEMINLYRRCLSKAGWEVIGETDPAKIDERVALHQPDLILLDINLPESDGWKLLEQLTTGEANSGIPVLVCSLENDTSRSANLGAAAHIIKPFVEADLIQAVQQANGETTSNGG